MPGWRRGPSCRVVSPSGGSILITSAPRSPSCWAAHGPSTTEVQSRIRTPASGPGTAVGSWGRSGRPARRRALAGGDRGLLHVIAERDGITHAREGLERAPGSGDREVAEVEEPPGQALVDRDGLDLGDE